MNEDEIYQGLISYADIISFLSNKDSSFSERVMKMIEDNNKHRRRQEILGLIFSFTLGIAGLGIGAFLALKGLSAAAITAVLGGISPIILAVIANLGQKGHPK